MGIDGFDLRGRFGNGDGIGPFANRERGIHHHFAVDVDDNAGPAKGLESSGVYLDVIASDGQTLE